MTFRRIGHEPNQTQARIHHSSAQVLQIVGAEGGGKSHVTAAEIAACVPWARLVYLVGQTYDNSRQEFEYLVTHLSGLGALEQKQISQPKHGFWSLTTRTGCYIVTLSVERGASSVIAKGQQPDIITLCEAGVIGSYSVFLASVRRARRSRGRVILVGTLKDDFGWYASLVDELQVFGNPWKGETYNLPAWTNTYLYPGGRQDPEIKYLEATMPPDEFSRTVAAEKVASRAQVFAKEFSYARNVRDCPFDPELPVDIWIDPGYYPSSYVVLPVQYYGVEVWNFDEIYVNFHTHQQVIALVKKQAWWWREVEEEKTGEIRKVCNIERIVIDVAGKQHHAERSAEEVWANEAGIRPRSQQVGVLDGIARHRTFLMAGRNEEGQPIARLFHDPKCKHTLEEYKKYRLPTDRDGNPTHNIPMDKENHSMKAIAYGLVDRFGFVDNRLSESVVIPRRDIIEEIDSSDW